MSAPLHLQVDSFVTGALTHWPYTWLTATCIQKDQPCLSLMIEIALNAS
jgi:hypothetical protein